MKHIIISAGLLVVVGAGLYGAYQNKPIEVMNVDTEVVEEATSVEEIDVIDSAKQELERVSQELDSEEARLLEDKGNVQIKYDAELQEIEARLSEIRKTRASFR